MHGKSNRLQLRKLPAMLASLVLFMFILGRFSNWPPIKLRNPDQAIVSLAFSHAGQLLHECRKLTQAELDSLPPNMRKPEECQRQRQPVYVIFKIDNNILYEASIAPTGIWSDGQVTIYKRLKISQGEHHIYIGMRDSKISQGVDYLHEGKIELKAGQHLAIEFDDSLKTFVFN